MTAKKPKNAAERFAKRHNLNTNLKFVMAHPPKNTKKYTASALFAMQNIEICNISA